MALLRQSTPAFSNRCRAAAAACPHLGGIVPRRRPPETFRRTRSAAPPPGPRSGRCRSAGNCAIASTSPRQGRGQFAQECCAERALPVPAHSAHDFSLQFRHARSGCWPPSESPARPRPPPAWRCQWFARSVSATSTMFNAMIVGPAQFNDLAGEIKVPFQVGRIHHHDDQGRGRHLGQALQTRHPGRFARPAIAG